MDELPFPSPIPTRPKKTPRKRRKFPLLRAIIDSCASFTFLPLADYARKEWRAVRRYPGFLMFCVLLAMGASWYATRKWYEVRTVDSPYTGETTLRLFFPGDGQPPQLVYQQNIYRYSCYVGEIHVASPGMDSKGEPLTITSEVKMWTVFIIFQREVDFDVRAMQWRTSNMNPPPTKIVFHECGRRGASFMIPQDIPAGQIEFRVEPAMPERDQYPTMQETMPQPSPTPSTAASPH